MTHSTALFWFRQDLRIDDNPALSMAISQYDAVIPVYIWTPEEAAAWQPGGASTWWLHHSLCSLQALLHQADSRLILRKGKSSKTMLLELCRSTGARAVCWNALYEPWALNRDLSVIKRLEKEGITHQQCHASLLIKPDSLLNKQGKPYQVFTAFWKAARQMGLPDVLSAPLSVPPPDAWPDSLTVQELKLEPTIDWAGGIRASWKPGSAGAMEALDKFKEDTVGMYQDLRDFPGQTGTSRLSPHLHFGEISPGMILQSLMRLKNYKGEGAQAYIRQLYWREFAHYLLYHFPHTAEAPLRQDFTRFPWKKDQKLLHAWQKGLTGYPIVDAGMRELWHTGWMHNRVRMIVASFLVKHLLQPWQDGADWFWDTLVDADLANNTLGWQWAAGCGADAAPYFRIFNPMLQGTRFDPKGVYVRRWVPEIAKLPDKYIHKPWEATEVELAAAGIQPGITYPRPIVDHKEAREDALLAFEMLKRESK